MIFEHPSQISLMGVHDRGIPGKERIVVRINESVDMSQFAMLVGVVSSSNVGDAIPISNLFFWFGSGVVNTNEWVHVYTGVGTPGSGIGTATNTKIYSVFWGNDKTIFESPNLVPILFQIGALVINKSVSMKNFTSVPQKSTPKITTM